jgi:hypothetical protein
MRPNSSRLRRLAAADVFTSMRYNPKNTPTFQVGGIIPP